MISSIVSAEWLNEHLNDNNLIVLDASIKKVTSKDSSIEEYQIPGTRYFDIKNRFSKTTVPFPNTVPSEEQFTREAQLLGINSDSILIIYDDKGIYSSARAWWLFKAFGHEQVAVLDGGLPEWKKQNLSLEEKQKHHFDKGNFTATYEHKYFMFFKDLEFNYSRKDKIVIDARSSERFRGIVPEPRKGLRSGTIPNSKNLPFSDLLDDGKMKSKEELQQLFRTINPNNKSMIFSCGSGITACVLALGAELCDFEKKTVYDGSWTEYGTLVK